MAFFNWPRLRRVLPAYLLDWLVIIVLLLVFVYLPERIPPFRRSFSVNDKTISFPFKENTISIVEDALISLLAPLILIVITALARRRSRRSFFDLHQGVLGLALATTLALSLTQLLKSGVGRLRPDFLARCKLAPGLQDPEYGLLRIEDVCTQTDLAILHDGSKSFPSGHTSLAFSGLTFLSLYWAGKLGVFYRRRGRPFKPVIILLPVFVAALVGVTRIIDYRHHWQDVTVGGLIGIVFAYLSYRQYYPSLKDSRSGLPYGIDGEPHPALLDALDLEHGPSRPDVSLPASNAAHDTAAAAIVPTDSAASTTPPRRASTLVSADAAVPTSTPPKTRTA